jgi:hypothetical protein
MPDDCAVDGRWPEVLDIVRFGHLGTAGDPAQPENVLIDGDEWRLIDELGPAEAYSELAPHLATGPRLLGNRGGAVRADEAAEGIDASLALIEPPHVEFLLRPAAETHDKLKPRVVFRLFGRNFELNLTDFAVRQRVLDAGLGTHNADDLGFGGADHTLLTVSLAEAYQEWHSKLAAAVLFLP